MLTNPPVPYDFCVGVPISRLLTVGSTPVKHSVLNVKALVGAFNQEKALVGAFSVIAQLLYNFKWHPAPDMSPCTVGGTRCRGVYTSSVSWRT